MGSAGLPGLILKVDAMDGMFVAEAIEVNFRTLEEGEIEKPSKGKEVTKEEFDKIMMVKMKEMREMFGGSHNSKH